MKHHFRRMLALVLVLCLVCPLALNAQAIGFGTGTRGNGFGTVLDDPWGPQLGNEGINKGKIETPKVEATRGPGMTLVPFENQSTISGDVELRASVYVAGDAAARAVLDDDKVVYYPSTFFDYDDAAINKSMADLEVQYAVDNGLSTSSNGWVWKGVYFGAGGSTEGRNDREVSRTGTGENGEATYTRANSVKCSALANGNVTNSQTSYYYHENGRYYPVYVTRTSRTEGSFFNQTTYYTFTLYANGKQIWTSGDITSTNTTVSNNVTLYTRSVPTVNVTSSTYAPWVKWGLNDTGANGAYIHSGMVTGLVDGVPQFVAPYASRLFDDSALNGKSRYTNVGLPFILDDDGYYTFDSSFNGAYFPNGVAASDVELELLDAPTVLSAYKRVNSGWEQNYYTCFMPFNQPNANKQNTTIIQTDGTQLTNQSVYRLPNSGSNTNNFFFGMITSVPFTMTENGKINPADETSDDIIFEFSGDDDVWVFVDDVLVLDLGGIHDPVSGQIDFATNEVTFDTCADGVLVGDATEGGFGANTDGTPIIQNAIFNEGETVGLLNTTRGTFAATDNHTLTIVYLERGSNMSNNKIRFNLPQKDYIAVTKHIDENLYKFDKQDEVDGQITPELFQTLNQRNFTYILYENGAAMANVRFSRYDANGNFVANGSTASDGTFNVKNGETVRFYDVEFDGENSYYVAELDPDYGSNNNAWGAATWNQIVRTAYAQSATVADTAKPANYYVSKTITTKGSDEAVDVIYFTNTNKLLSPVADINNDEYVLDFGLTVELNPLANDTFSATSDSLILLGISATAEDSAGTEVDGEFGTLKFDGGKLTYTLDEQLTDAEVFYYHVGLSSNNSFVGVGTITIMPATTMYYEEGFAGLNLTLTNPMTGEDLEWEDKGTPQGGYQEEGRVGNTADSPYGSDAVYKKNTGDSYGTSRYVNTTDAAATFSYTFTGTGTALYARTSDKSAYMIITVLDKDGNEVPPSWSRNTIYKPTADTALTDNTLYNIPVYTFNADEYGTYTVKVDLSKAIKANGEYYRGCDFYLDGIRVYNPANAYAEEGEHAGAITQIENAYARDGEAFITVDSLRNKLLSDYTKYEMVVDENGDPVVDEYGEPVYEIAWDGVNYVVFTDSNGEIRDAQTYQSAGPKEEVYVKNGQSVTFSLDNWDQNQNKIFLGIKAPSGSGTVYINGRPIEINNTTDIYYDITNYANVSEGVATFRVTAGSALISVTTIKVTGTADFTIVSGAPEIPDEEP